MGCRRIEILAAAAAQEIVGSAVLVILGMAVPLASFVAGIYVDCTIVTGRLATFDGVLVVIDRNLGCHHKDTAVHNRHCLRAQYGKARKTGPVGSLFRFSPQEVLLCRYLWTAHTRNKLPHKATNNGLPLLDDNHVGTDS